MALTAALRRLPVQTAETGLPHHNRRETGPTTEATSAMPYPVFEGDGGYGQRTSSSSSQAARADSITEPATGSALSLLEAALDAWADCQPDGYSLPESSVYLVLPSVACHVPGSYTSEGTTQMLNELFKPEVDEDGSVKASVFERMLKAHNGQVHFLHFWRAFSKAARLLASYGGSVAVVGGDEELALELETLRDSILRSLELEEMQAIPCGSQIHHVPQGASSSPSSSSRSRKRERTMSSAQLVEAVQAAAAMSSSPEFWRTAEQALADNTDDTRLSIEEITVVILSWLRDAIAWQHERPDESQSIAAVPGEASLLPPAPTAKAINEIPIFLHIYDVSAEEGVQKLNGWLAARYSPLKFGGIFHAGVEVNSLEWSFGQSCSETMPGISCVEPKTHPAHHYRQTVQLRSTKLSAEQIADLLSQLIEEYPGDDYDLLRRNCCHFADDFCRRLGAGRIPGWVHRLARVGARLDGALQAVTGRKLLNLEDDSD